jgi:hypothetical protein
MLSDPLILQAIFYGVVIGLLVIGNIVHGIYLNKR